MKAKLKPAIETALSYSLTIGILVYGIGKVKQFTGVTDPNKLLAEFTGMELMWAFYRHSQFYGYIIGFFEVLGGVLVAFKRTRLAGCLLLTTILLNIILQDYFYDVFRGAFVTALYYQAIILVLMIFNKDQLLQIFRTFFQKPTTKPRYSVGIVILIVLMVIFFKVFEYFLTIRWLG